VSQWAALRLVKVCAATADAVRRPAGGLTVLLYHRVGRRTGVEVDLPTALFEQQVGAIVAAGGVVTLDAALAGPVAAGTVAVTFDDGTADFVEVALPILADHAVPCTLYLATGFVDSGRPFPDDGRPASWAALRDALATGLVTVGSHTDSHALLDRVGAAEAAAELDRSIGLIQDRLGVTPHHFAYPKAVLGSPEAEAEVRRRFDSAAVAGTRANQPGTLDRYRLRRSPIQVADGMRWFRRKLEGGMALEDDLRRLLNRRRYAGAAA
jgi:peptidoglycan/xylan/chitin deacetylase (PgdA/CDA1 family)